MDGGERRSTGGRIPDDRDSIVGGRRRRASVGRLGVKRRDDGVMHGRAQVRVCPVIVERGRAVGIGDLHAQLQPGEDGRPAGPASDQFGRRVGAFGLEVEEFVDFGGAGFGRRLRP